MSVFFIVRISKFSFFEWCTHKCNGSLISYFFPLYEDEYMETDLPNDMLEGSDFDCISDGWVEDVSGDERSTSPLEGLKYLAIVPTIKPSSVNTLEDTSVGATNNQVSLTNKCAKKNA